MPPGPANAITKQAATASERAVMIAPPVPRSRPTAVVTLAPTTAPTPARPVATPSWNGESPRVSSAYGATTTPSTAFAANHTWVETASRASPDPR